MAEENSRAVKLLLVEDNPAEVQRLKEFLQEVAIPTTLHAVERGEVALAFLRNEGQYAEAPPPDVMVLDLDLLTAVFIRVKRLDHDFARNSPGNHLFIQAQTAVNQETGRLR